MHSMDDDYEEESNVGMPSGITLKEFKDQYLAMAPRYHRLGESLLPVLKTLLAEAALNVLTVTYRIKDSGSAAIKITRKKYSDPMSDIEDWCGIRIICYYSSDIEKISEILRSEFNVLVEENVADRTPDDFGYRSTHFIIKLKQEWLGVPNYRGLGDLKAEVQVRTVLMHAWAEIEHKLAYKEEGQVPSQLRRKLRLLSGNLEQADDQFETLRIDSAQYRKSVTAQADQNLESVGSGELNLDSLRAFLDSSYPRRSKDPVSRIADLLSDLNNLKISMSELVDAVRDQKHVINDMEKLKGQLGWSQVKALQNALELTNEKYFQHRNVITLPSMEMANPFGYVARLKKARTKLQALKEAGPLLGQE